MRIVTRLNLLSLASVLAMTLAVVVAAVLFFRGAQQQAYERLMRLEWQHAALAIQQRLNRSGVVAASEEAQAQLIALRAKDGFASADIVVVERNDNRVVFDANHRVGERTDEAVVDGMMRLHEGTLQYESKGLRRMVVFDTLEPIHWLVGVSVLRSEIDASLFAFLRTVGSITLFALCLNAMLVSLFGRWLVRRLEGVLECVKQIDRGDLSARVAHAGPDDEVGTLQFGVNTMAERLEQRTRERREGQAALEASEARLRRLIESSIVGVFYWEITGEITEANDAFLSMVGCTRDDLDAGRLDWKKLTPEQHASTLRSVDEELRGTGHVRPYEKHYLRKDGSLVPVLVGGVFLTDSEQQGVSFVVDLTERRQGEADRHARQDAEAANRAKSAFLASMSHEIRTPMNAIIGLSYLMARETHDPRQLDRLGKIDGAAKHLLQVINDILDLSKIEAGKMTLEEVEFSPDEVAAAALDMVRADAAAKGLELVLDTGCLPGRLLGDPTRLSQALINLLSNAVKFTSSGWVRLRARVLREEGERLLVRFEVQDTGEGVPAERQQDVFNAFEQADNSTTRRHGGTGLGLALTRHLAAMMGGEVGLHSTLHEGSTFWITAWLRRTTQPLDQHVPLSAHPLHALLVDDLPEALSALGDGLRRLGLTVDALGSGGELLAQIRADASSIRRCDVLLIDAGMAPPDGTETLRQLRLMLGAGMPASILMSPREDVELRLRAREICCDAVLVKPVGDAVLHQVLVEVLRLREAAASGSMQQPGSGPGLEQQLKLQHAGQRVLLAEDNPINQEVARELLGAAGLVVEVAENGADAVEQATTRAYDLVLMDVQMPALDGLAATRLIRQRAGPGLPIVAMTANALNDDRAACLEAGMNDHVAKPVEPAVLYATLLRWLPPRDKTSGAAAGPQQGRDEMPAESIRQRLAAIPGFDLARALRNAGGRSGVLYRVLAMFAQTYRTGAPEMLDAGSPVALALWRRQCHTLRGACETIGATALSASIYALESALNRPADLNALVPLARQVHEDLVTLSRLIDAAYAGYEVEA